MTLEVGCVRESYLRRKLDTSVAFAQDLDIYRRKVAEGFDPELAYEQLEAEEIRPFSENISAELKACLGNIAAGVCPIYNNIEN